MPGAPQESVPEVRFVVEPPLERRLAQLAEAQHAVAGIGQLRELGLSARAIQKRAVTQRVHAAVLAYGPRAALSHRSATAHRGLSAERSGLIDVSVPAPSARSRPGIRAHATLSLSAADVTVDEGIPTTTVARTLLDLAEVASRREVERAIDRAEVLRVFDLADVEAALERANGRRGAGALRRALEATAAPAPTMSELEEAFLALCATHRLPRPEVNVWVALGGGHIRADFLWRAERLVVETDGYAFHSGLRAFERDHDRDTRLWLAGWKVRRFTWRQVTQQAQQTAATVRAALAGPH